MLWTPGSSDFFQIGIILFIGYNALSFLDNVSSVWRCSLISCPFIIHESLSKHCVPLYKTILIHFTFSAMKMITQCYIKHLLLNMVSKYILCITHGVIAYAYTCAYRIACTWCFHVYVAVAIQKFNILCIYLCLILPIERVREVNGNEWRRFG